MLSGGVQCKRCSLCDISYPFSTQACPVCGGDVDALKRPPDADWREKVRLAKEATERPRTDPVFDWRLKCMLEAGAELEHATEVAMEPRIDLHKAVSMIAAGCPPELVPAILAPIEYQAPPPPPRDPRPGE